MIFDKNLIYNETENKLDKKFIQAELKQVWFFLRKYDVGETNIFFKTILPTTSETDAEAKDNTIKNLMTLYLTDKELFDFE